MIVVLFGQLIHCLAIDILIRSVSLAMPTKRATRTVLVRI